MKSYCRMPEGCCDCKHFRNKPFVHKRLRIGYCAQVDDGYSGDCRLACMHGRVGGRVGEVGG